MSTRKKKPAKRRAVPRHILEQHPAVPSASRSFDTFTKCVGCGEGTIDLVKFPIHHRPECKYATQENVIQREPPGPRPSVAPTLRYLIAKAINSVSAEDESDTPDFILARFLTDCLSAFDHATRHRGEWYSSNGVTSREFLAPGQRPAPEPPDDEDGRRPSHASWQELKFAISDEQMGTFGAGWRQRLAGNAALPPNLSPTRLDELKRLAILNPDNVDLGHAVMKLNGPEGFRP